MWRDDAYLLDILVAARKALGFTKGATEFRVSGWNPNPVLSINSGQALSEVEGSNI